MSGLRTSKSQPSKAEEQHSPNQSSSNRSSPQIMDPELVKFFAAFSEEPESGPLNSSIVPSSISGQEERQKSLISFFPNKFYSISSPTSSNTLTSEFYSHQSTGSSAAPPWPQGDYPSTFNDDRVEDPSKPSPAFASLGTDMSCQTAFDYAWHCSSIGGQWASVYRTGTMSRCSEQWGDFWFCMRTRTITGEAKENAYREYFREKERKKYENHPNSEDIWKPRNHVVRENAFLTHRLPKFDKTDEEWVHDQIKERKELRDKLDLGPEGGNCDHN